MRASSLAGPGDGPRREPGVSARTEVLSGRPAQQLLHAAERAGADLVVLGRSGHCALPPGLGPPSPAVRWRASPAVVASACAVGSDLAEVLKTGVVIVIVPTKFAAAVGGIVLALVSSGPTPRNPQPGVPWRWRTPLPASLVMGLTTSLAPGADGPYRDTSGGTMHSTSTRAPDHPRRRPQAMPTRHGSGHHRVPAGTPETRP